jgi:hypothetical protein
VLGSLSLSGTEADLSFAESEAEGQDIRKGGRERGEGQGQRAAATLGENKKTLCETQTRREVGREGGKEGGKEGGRDD